MRKYVMILSLAFFLSGCGVVVPKFPSYPEEIGVPCPELVLVDEKEEKLSEVLKVVTKNYGQYHECRAKVQAWIDWHKEQKQIFEDIKK